MQKNRIFLIGDDYSGTGPANATLALKNALPADTLTLASRGKVKRAFEILRKMPDADAAVFSGYSRQNLLGMKIAKIFHIPSIYLMHGCVEYEDRINRVPDEAMARDERKMLAMADLILGVSEQFADWLRDYYPEERRKIDFLTNGVSWEQFETGEKNRREERKLFSVLSVGGGMPRKRIVRIAEAVAFLRENGFPDMELTVAGAEGADSAEIRRFSFVNDLGLLSPAEMQSEYRKHSIYIQNSIFETFGLAPLEALLSGEDLLMSDRCGVLSVLSGIEERDLIHNPDDPMEIAEKIRELLTDGNHDRLINAIDKESTSWNSRAQELQRIVLRLRSGRRS